MKLVLSLLVSCAFTLGAAPHRFTRYHVRATAFSQQGITKAGTVAHLGTVAADPAFLPIGTEIRLHQVGVLDATYVVADTGAKVIGRHIDIYLPTPAAAHRFGTRIIWIQVLKWGEGDVSPETDRAVHKQAVKTIIANSH